MLLLRFLRDTPGSNLRLVLILVCLPLLGISQNRKELEKKRVNIQNEIKETTRLLQQSTKLQKNEYSRFQILQSQVQKREELVLTLRKELKLVDGRIDSNKKEISKQESDVAKLVDEYGTILRKVHKINMATDKTLLLLSSKDFNQAFQRWLYINQIKKVRQTQSEIIKTKIEELKEKNKQLENYRNEKEFLLKAEEGQKVELAKEVEEKNQLISSLKQDEVRLKKQLLEKEKASQKLNEEIQRIIALEIEKQRKEAEAKAAAEKLRKEKEAAAAAASGKKPAPAVAETTPVKKPITKPTDLPATPETKALSDEFAKNKGKLPWPVQKGTISKRFGTQPHPILPTLSITNTGIDIRSEKGTSVRAVFKGKVIGKTYIPTKNYTVMVQHGTFYTIYGGLDEVNVKEGQLIQTGEVIGRAFEDEEEVFSEVHFEIWQNKTNHDPALWLKR